MFVIVIFVLSFLDVFFMFPPQSFSVLMSGLQTNAAARADRQAAAAGDAWSRSISAARSLGPEVRGAACCWVARSVDPGLKVHGC